MADWTVCGAQLRSPAPGNCFAGVQRPQDLLAVVSRSMSLKPAVPRVGFGAQEEYNRVVDGARVISRVSRENVGLAKAAPAPRAFKPMPPPITSDAELLEQARAAEARERRRAAALKSREHQPPATSDGLRTFFRPEPIQELDMRVARDLYDFHRATRTVYELPPPEKPKRRWVTYVHAQTNHDLRTRALRDQAEPPTLKADPHTSTSIRAEMNRRSARASERANRAEWRSHIHLPSNQDLRAAAYLDKRQGELRMGESTAPREVPLAMTMNGCPGAVLGGHSFRDLIPRRTHLMLENGKPEFELATLARVQRGERSVVT